MLGLLACGRFQFDSAPDDGRGPADGAGGEWLDAPDTALVDAADILPDAATRRTCASTNQRVTTTGNAHAPSLVWTGTEYGLVWTSASAAYFVRLSASGAPVGAATEISGANPVDIPPRIVWTGGGYVIAWVAGQNPSARMVHLDVTGTQLGQATQITPQASGAFRSFAFTYTGSEYAIAWIADSALTFGRRDDAGATLGTDASFATSFTGDMSPNLVWTGAEYAMAYAVNGAVSCGDVSWRVEHRRIDAAGVLQAPQVVDSWSRFGFSTCGESGYVRLDRAATGYAVTYVRSDGQGGASTFAILGATGIRQGAIHPLGAPVGSPVVTGSGGDYGVGWVDTATNPDHVVLAHRDFAGKLVGLEDQITDAATVGATTPHVAWTGTQHVVAWSDQRDGTGGEIYVAIGCP
jgi:hypothetical protein